MESACELAVYLAMIEPPPCESVDAGLAEVMARLQPTDYLFAKRTLDALGLADDAATLKKCLLTALWGNPFAMTSLQLHFLKASAGVPRPPDDLYCYWAVRRAATGINQLVRLELPERMRIISHAYCSRDAEPRHGEKKRWRHVEAVVEQLKHWGFSENRDELFFAVGYGHLLFAETQLTPKKLAAFGETGLDLEEMAEVVSLIQKCDRESEVTADMPEAVLAVRLADVLCEAEQCRKNGEDEEASSILLKAEKLIELASRMPWGRGIDVLP